MKRQKSIDVLLQVPLWFLFGASVIFAVVLLFRGDWRGCIPVATLAVLRYMRASGARESGERLHREHIGQIRQLTNQPVDQLVEELRDWRAVPIPESIAFPRRFPPTSFPGRPRYFEWKEIVFRVERDPHGLAVISVRDEDIPNQTHQHNAGDRPQTNDSPASATPSSPAPRG